jgi:RNA polymerase sigma-B factor
VSEGYTREDTKRCSPSSGDGGPGDPRGARALHLPLVEYLARRFKDRGEPLDDLVQVGSVGLLKAIDRFDLERGVEFSTYATPTIVGELKRYFRDKGWASGCPRRLQELSLRMNKLVAQLTQDLGRSPTVPELAKAAGSPRRRSSRPSSPGRPTRRPRSTRRPATARTRPLRLDRIGEEDVALENLEYFASLAPLIERLPERERRSSTCASSRA